MSEMITLEVHFFLGSFLSGILLVAIYDVLRLLRRMVRHSRAFVNGEDFLFWGAASIFIFRVIYRLNDGKIRSFGILCMAAGMLLYHFSLSDALVELFYRAFELSVLKAVRLAKKGLKKLLRPFTIGIKKLKKLKKVRKVVRRKHEGKQKSKQKDEKEDKEGS